MFGRRVSEAKKKRKKKNEEHVAKRERERENTRLYSGMISPLFLADENLELVNSDNMR